MQNTPFINNELYKLYIRGNISEVFKGIQIESLVFGLNKPFYSICRRVRFPLPAFLRDRTARFRESSFIHFHSE